MPYHREPGEHGRGVSRRHVLERMMVTDLSPVTLDTGDADEFTSSKAGALAYSQGFYPCEQGKLAVAS
ncbi:hypothetical protein [Mesorhizobium sp. B263B2A]|uniref:hypothetical protein n=1 Tax=Mesorhizobium sp. B263B2A TaxID=2876669 RepID=UPI001CD0C9B9|nr:hypothetical protein [Mesorhizobium sp. B263B2A]MCA0031038.1 hypothetical protein [Mesorhizobium sp. B263B2A]